MKNDLSRRGFVKGVGLLMGAAGMVGCGIPKTDDVKKRPRFDANGLTIRKRGHKYPWWVKTVDKMTTEVDPKIAEPVPMINAFTNFPALEHQDYVDEAFGEAKACLIDGIVNNSPGNSLPDVALHYAAQGYANGTIGSIDTERVMILPEVEKKIQNWHLFPPQHFGLPAWQASPEEASKIVNAAAIQLGASQVGFTELNRNWIHPMAVFDPDISTHDIDLFGGKINIPSSYKYCVMFLVQAPRDLTVRSQSHLGDAGDRAAYANQIITSNNIIRFIKGLGYNAASLQFIGPVIPHAIQAGLGELGRMNRMISPIFGGNFRLEGIMTDLPLAVDQPIDFGLQEFCKNCKICAKNCPVGALSMADEPYWTPVNAFQSAGKKAYFEDCKKCLDYWQRTGHFCSTCVSVCPWSKMDKTALHDISKVLSSQVPKAGKILTKMDEAFGYGLIEADSPEMADWWDLDIPQWGVDSFQGTGEM